MTPVWFGRRSAAEPGTQPGQQQFLPNEPIADMIQSPGHAPRVNPDRRFNTFSASSRPDMPPGTLVYSARSFSQLAVPPTGDTIWLVEY